MLEPERKFYLILIMRGKERIQQLTAMATVSKDIGLIPVLKLWLETSCNSFQQIQVSFLASKALHTWGTNIHTGQPPIYIK